MSQIIRRILIARCLNSWRFWPTSSPRRGHDNDKVAVEKVGCFGTNPSPRLELLIYWSTENVDASTLLSVWTNGAILLLHVRRIPGSI